MSAAEIILSPEAATGAHGSSLKADVVALGNTPEDAVGSLENAAAGAKQKALDQKKRSN